MRLNLRHAVLAVGLGIGIGGGAVQIVAAPFLQDKPAQPDYSKNAKYQQGVREGQDDRTNNKDHSKKRHYKKDEDQKAYEAGYQQAHR